MFDNNLDIQKYYAFEKDNNLFEIKDKYGNYIWDIYHYAVRFSIILTPSAKSILKKQEYSNVFKRILRIPYYLGKIFLYSLITFFPSKRKYFCFLNSRNKLNEKYFDQNMYDVLKCIDKKNMFLFETGNTKNKIYNQFVGHISVKSLLYKIFELFFSFDRITIGNIYYICKEHFPTLSLSEKDFIDLYKRFYFDKKFYSFLFKIHKIQKVFLTQNEIQKGLFFAAKKLGIQVFEFQHGIVYDGHTAYSYPKIDGIESKIYMPSVVLTLSDFWFSDFYLPAKKVTIGNNYFSHPVQCCETEYNLVISANLYGADLVPWIKYAVQKTNEKFIFKLHPNEFNNINYYLNEFRDFPQVSVITNECCVNQLLCKAKKMITVGSTAVYEALQAGVPCIICTVSIYYFALEHISNCDGYNLCNTKEQLVDLINNKRKIKPTVFFEPFDKEKAMGIIDDSI